MRRVIIESPFSSGTAIPIRAVVERNIRYLRACLRDALIRGESPYASHGLYTQEGVLDDTKPEERRMGMEAGFAWLAGAEANISYVDLGVSSGMTEGAKRAGALGLPCEIRKLGGAWGRCVGYSCIGWSDHRTTACPAHVYECSMWRAA